MSGPTGDIRRFLVVPQETTLKLEFVGIRASTRGFS
jgi:hypothetical protein